MSLTSELHARVVEVARRMPERLAVSNETDSATFAELRDRAERVRPLLRASEGPVSALVAVGGGPWLTALQVAGLAEDALVAPVNRAATAHELGNYLTRLGPPDLVFVEPETGARPDLSVLPRGVRVVEVGTEVRDVPAFGGDAAASADRSGAPRYPPGAVLGQFTSGSTGLPKCVLLSAENFRAHLENHGDYLAGLGGRAVFLPMPQHHAFGNTVAIESLLYGSPVHVANAFAPALDIERIGTHECALVASGPTYVRMLMTLGTVHSDIPSVNAFVLGTAPVDGPLIQSIREAFPGTTTHVRYGATETLGPVTRLTVGPDDELPSAGSVGPPLAGVRLSADCAGARPEEPLEVRVRSGIVALAALEGPGSWRSLVDDEGYYATGDLGYVDADGHLILCGRKSEFVKQNGFRINPYEIEALVRAHPAVVETAAVGVPHPLMGERLVLCVEPAAEHPPTLAAELRASLKANLAQYKQPQKTLIVESLPRTASNKPDRPAIRKLAAG